MYFVDWDRAIFIIMARTAFHLASQEISLNFNYENQLKQMIQVQQLRQLRQLRQQSQKGPHLRRCWRCISSQGLCDMPSVPGRVKAGMNFPGSSSGWFACDIISSCTEKGWSFLLTREVHHANPKLLPGLLVKLLTLATFPGMMLWQATLALPPECARNGPPSPSVLR